MRVADGRLPELIVNAPFDIARDLVDRQLS
jgi:hypothetical protein